AHRRDNASSASQPLRPTDTERVGYTTLAQCSTLYIRFGYELQPLPQKTLRPGLLPLRSATIRVVTGPLDHLFEVLPAQASTRRNRHRTTRAGATRRARHPPARVHGTTAERGHRAENRAGRRQLIRAHQGIYPRIFF